MGWNSNEFPARGTAAVAIVVALSLASGCAAGETLPTEDFEPSIAQLHAYKAYHHADYLEKTAAQAGGTNRLLHTKRLPTEGNDPVVTPALDHLYSKAVIDLTQGPVVLEMPNVADGRYYSIHVTDQEHYTIYEEIRPVGRYAFVRMDANMTVPAGATPIESRGAYPHLFIRVQVKTPDDLPNTLAVQEQITLTGAVGTLEFDNPIQFTIDTHDVYDENAGLLAGVASSYDGATHEQMSQWAGAYFTANIIDNTGMFGPIDSDEAGADDPKVRAAAIIGHLGLPVHHAYYTGIFNNNKGEPLNGSVSYTVRLPYENNIGEFWSLTRYSALTRNTLPGQPDVYNAFNTEPDADGNVHITFSVDDPQDGTYWMPVIAGEPYYYVERFYGPRGKVITTLDGFEK